LYNQVTKDIADRISITLTPQEKKLLAEERSVDNEAYDAYIKGLSYYDQLGKEDLEKAEEYFKAAIEIDPNWAPPYAGIAYVGMAQKQMAFVEPSTVLQKIYENLYKALELDPNSAESHYVMAGMAVWTEWDWEKGEREFLKSLELNPNNAGCRMAYAHLLMILQRSDEALYHANMALELDPMKPTNLGFYAVVKQDVGDYQSAINHCEKALSIDPDHHFAKDVLEGSYYLNGDYQKSIEMLIHTWIPIFFPDKENIKPTFKKAFEEQGYSAAIEFYIGVKEEIAKEGYIPPQFIANSYMRVKKYDKVLDWLEKGYDIHDPGMPYIGTLIYRSDQLKNNPRYIKLMKKMNLPLP
jgi:tetratricopeptide (TPR) repeat protein